MKILYEYKCSHCGQYQEHFWERNSDLTPNCTSCGNSTYKLISTSAFTFKEGQGSGTSGGHLMRFSSRNKNGI